MSTLTSKRTQLLHGGVPLVQKLIWLSATRALRDDLAIELGNLGCQALNLLNRLARLAACSD